LTVAYKKKLLTDILEGLNLDEERVGLVLNHPSVHFSLQADFRGRNPYAPKKMTIDDLVINKVGYFQFSTCITSEATMAYIQGTVHV